MTQTQHKIISTVIISAITLLGFESLSVFLSSNELEIFFKIALLIFAYHVFWVAFMFDLHLRNRGPVAVTSAKFRHLVLESVFNRLEHVLTWKYLRHFLNQMILPTILYWSTVALIYLNPFDALTKQSVIIISSIFLVFSYWHMKEHMWSRFERNHAHLEYAGLAKLLTSYMAYASIIGLGWYFAVPSLLVFYSTFAVTYFLIYQALYAHDHHRAYVLILALAASLAIGLLAIWVYRHFGHDYLTAGIVLLAIYNLVWGFAKHHVTKTFTGKLALEYLMFTILIVSIILASHSLSPKVV